MTTDRSHRSFAPLTAQHLDRLAEIARADHEGFRRSHPEWAGDQLAACLVQGGARHFLHGDRGVKDLDVYLFYACPPGRSAGHFPWLRGGATRTVDLGPSELGRQAYSAEERAEPGVARRLHEWERYRGRRVDVMSRAITAEPAGPRFAVRTYLTRAASTTARHLSQAPVVCLYPEPGAVWWSGPADDLPGREKGLYGDR